jgi:bacterial/archaeal transporter family protein
MATWFCYAVAAAILYGAQQIFARLTADRIGDRLGGFVVEATAAFTILLYLAPFWFGGVGTRNLAMKVFITRR